MTPEEKAKQTVKVFGQDLPKWEDCKRCGMPLACNFVDKIGYYQPCESCRQSKEYRQELDQAMKQKATKEKVDDSLKARQPTAVYNTPWGTELTINHRGDILAEEKQGTADNVRKGKAKMRTY